MGCVFVIDSQNEFFVQGGRDFFYLWFCFKIDFVFIFFWQFDLQVGDFVQYGGCGWFCQDFYDIVVIQSQVDFFEFFVLYLELMDWERVEQFVGEKVFYYVFEWCGCVCNWLEIVKWVDGLKLGSLVDDYVLECCCEVVWQVWCEFYCIFIK